MEIAPRVNAPQSGCSPTCLREKSAASSRRHRTPNNPWCRARSTRRLSRRGRAGPNSRSDACREVAQPANIGGLTANEVAIAFGRVGVAALAVPVEQPQGHQRIEEVAGTARMNAGPRLQRLEVERSFGENAEHVELGGDEQHFGLPKQIAGADDTVRKSFG